jgi:hypothetical protein
MGTVTQPRRPDSDEQVLRRLARLTELRESADHHARNAVVALRRLSALLQRAQPPRR